MALTDKFRALGRLFVSACLGSQEETRLAISAAVAAGVKRDDVDEVLLLVIAYAGIPRAILGFTAWREVEKSIASPTTIADRRKAGERTFASVYGARTDRIRDELKALHPVLLDAILEDSYGRILARRGLDAHDRELLAVAMLIGLGAPRQAAAHAIGALRAKASPAEILEAADLASPYAGPEDLVAAKASISDMLRKE
jgi:4-carboxymuconolactone decarboxylase